MNQKEFIDDWRKIINSDNTNNERDLSNFKWYQNKENNRNYLATYVDNSNSKKISQRSKVYEKMPEGAKPAMLTKQERDYMEGVLDEFLNDGGVQDETTVHSLLDDKSKDKARVKEFGWRLRKKLGDVDRE